MTAGHPVAPAARPVAKVIDAYVMARERGDVQAIEVQLAGRFLFRAGGRALDRGGYLERWRNGDFPAARLESRVDGESAVALCWRTATGERFVEWVRIDGTLLAAIDAFGAQADALEPSRNPTLAASDGDLHDYACLVHQDDDTLRALDDESFATIVRRTLDWLQHLQASGRHVVSAGLQSVTTAATVQGRNGRVSTTDGPFTETKEHLGGFTVLKARDLNEAIAIASSLAAASGTTIEVRPLLKLDVPLAAPLDRRLADVLRASVR